MYEAVKRCIGLVEYHYCKKVTPCSGSMILAANKTIIATAAHCIFDWKSKQFYDEISFTPYILRERKRYKVQEAYILKRWADKAEVEFDTGFLVVDDQLKNDLDYCRYAINPIFGQESCLYYLCGGFTYNPFRKSPYFFQGKSIKDTYYDSTLLGIQHKVKNGMSGGPWIIEKNGMYFQNSLTSFTNKQRKGFVWGPYWGKEIKLLYEEAIKECSYSQSEGNITKFIF